MAAYEHATWQRVCVCSRVCVCVCAFGYACMFVGTCARVFSEIRHPFQDISDEAFLCVVKSQKRRSKKIYKTKLTKIRYKIK